MDVVAFSIEEKESKKTGKNYYILYALTKNGDKFFIKFVNKTA